MKELQLKGEYQQNVSVLDRSLRIGASFDVIRKDMRFAGVHACLYFIDGFLKDAIMEKILQFLLSIKEEQLADAPDAQSFCERFITYLESDAKDRVDDIVTGVLSGTAALLIEGYSQAIMIDARTYPARETGEPDDDRVLRGSRDGFVETLVNNTALIRRRIRDPALTMEILSAGEKSRTDIVLCYLQGSANPKVVAEIRRKIQKITIGALTMNQESLAECLVKRQWFNPFPKVRYTERPDAASASVMEGGILILVDNSPSVMILPTSIFDFVQDTNDYYFPPLVGTYLRLVRIVVFLLTLFLTPAWYLLIKNPAFIPSWLSFIQVEEPNQVPILLQLLLIEFIVDGLKLASLNTPSVLSNSFSVVGALILGDFAVQARWFVPEVVLYMAFVSIANFTQPSFELGYALKLFRVLILILTALLNGWGFVLGVALMIVTAACTKTISGGNYLYPFVPFRPRAILRLLIRQPINRYNTSSIRGRENAQ